MIPFSRDWSLEIFIVHVPIDGPTLYSVFNTVGLHCQTSVLTPACKAGRQFVPFSWWWWSLVWQSRGANPRHIAWVGYANHWAITKPCNEVLYQSNHCHCHPLSMQGRRNSLGIGGGGKKNSAQFLCITHSYHKDTILYIGISVISIST